MRERKGLKKKNAKRGCFFLSLSFLTILRPVKDSLLIYPVKEFSVTLLLLIDPVKEEELSKFKLFNFSDVQNNFVSLSDIKEAKSENCQTVIKVINYFCILCTLSRMKHGVCNIRLGPSAETKAPNCKK